MSTFDVVPSLEETGSDTGGISQGEFVRNSWKLTKGIGAYLLLKWLGIEGVNIALDTPEFDPNHPAESLPLDLQDLSFIERTTPQPRAPFLTGRGGNRESLRQVVLNNQVVRGSIDKAYNRMLTEQNEFPLFADLMTEHLLLARDALSKEYPEFNSLPEHFQAYQCLAHATYSLTAIMGSWIKMHEFRAMGVDFPDQYRFVDHQGLSPTYKLWGLLPAIFPTEYSSEITKGSPAHLFLASGKDKSVHFMNHFFVASRYIGLTVAKNQDAERMPLGLKLLLLTERDLYSRVLRICDSVGIVWELKELFEGSHEDGSLPAGYWDPTVQGDLDANRLGAQFAIETFEYLSNNTDKTLDELLSGIRVIFLRLEDAEYKVPTKILKMEVTKHTVRYYTEDL